MNFSKIENIDDILNWLEKFEDISSIKESLEQDINLHQYDNLSVQEIGELLSNLGREKQLIDNKLKQIHIDSVPKGISPQMATCFLQMPDEIIEHIKTWNTVKKSPYSCSLYSEKEIGWNFKPDGCFSVSDHWNFFLKGKYHKLTDKPVINNTHITLCKFNKNISPLESHIIKKRIDEGELTPNIAIENHKTDGVWEVVISLPKDKTKLDNIDLIRNRLKEIQKLIKYLRELKDIKNGKIKFNKNMNNIKSFNNFEKENITENHSDGDNVEIFNKQKNSVISKNKEYNFEPIPDKHRDKDPNYKYVISKKIEIGDKDPIKKFREWEGKYWRKKKDRKKKYEPQAKQ